MQRKNTAEMKVITFTTVDTKTLRQKYDVSNISVFCYVDI